MIQNITAEAFAPYGKLFKAGEGDPASHDDISAYWHDVCGDMLGSDDIVTGFLTVRSQPMLADELERHQIFGEVFITVGGEGILAVAPAGDSMDTESVELFRVRPGDAFLLKKGVWHKPPVPAKEEISFFMVLPKDILSDIDKRKISAVSLTEQA